MTKSEKKKYNARYYREHKDYWKNLARNHGQYANREELRLSSAQSRHARIRNEPHLTLSPELKAKTRRYANQAISSAAALNEASKARANAKDRYNYWKHNNTSSAAKEFVKALLAIGPDYSFAKKNRPEMYDTYRKTKLKAAGKEFVSSILL